MIGYVKTWLEISLDRRAVTALEYGLLAGVIVGSIVVGFQFLGISLSQSFATMAGGIRLP